MKLVRLLALASVFAAATVHATLVREKFATDPALDGWQVFGDASLFQWDATNQALDVTWDSTHTNSYFYYPLDRTYTRADGFYVRFDLQLQDAVSFNYGMELAVGLLHFNDATNAGFSRANFTSPNVCEFDYFPSFSDGVTTYPDSVETTMIDDSGENVFFASDNVTLNAGVTYRIELIHSPGAASIRCDITTTNGQLVSTLPVAGTYGAFGDFQVDMLSVTSYSDDGYGDSILAHGSVGNLAFASPLPVGLLTSTAAGQVQFASDTNWLYTLGQSEDFLSWKPAAPTVLGNGSNLLLQATNPPTDRAFYRVRAVLP